MLTTTRAGVLSPGNTTIKNTLAKTVSQKHKWRFYRHPCRWHRDQKRRSESGYIIPGTEEKVGASKPLFCNVLDLIWKILRKNEMKKVKFKMGDISKKARLCSHLRASSGVFILHDWWCVYVSATNVTRNWLPRFQIMQLCRQSAMLVLEVLGGSNVSQQNQLINAS